VQAMLPSVKNLDQIVHVDKLQTEETATIRDLWMAAHEISAEHTGKYAGAVLTKSAFAGVQERARRSPQLVLPLFRGDGFFMLFTQFVDEVPEKNIVFAMSMEEYRSAPAAALPFINIAFYNEFADEKDTVLVRAESMNQHVTNMDVTHALFQWLRCYAGDDAAAHTAVETFNHNSEAFVFDPFIESCRPQKAPPTPPTTPPPGMEEPEVIGGADVDGGAAEIVSETERK
jgi:hypothetical protein